MKNYDMLDYLLKEEDPRYKLNDEEILDQVVMILYSGFETVSTTSMMAIKYLHDHPSALQEIRVSNSLYIVENRSLLKTCRVNDCFDAIVCRMSISQ